MQRSCGILLPIFSLPSRYGIGTFGKAAYSFVDFLNKAGQSYWQILPLGPTSYGDSPYQCLSSFAGNPYFIDLDMLVQEGLLNKNDLSDLDPPIGPINYAHLFKTRYFLLKKAARTGLKRDKKAVLRFAEENKEWIHDFALYFALKEHFGSKAWFDWDDAIKNRDEKALDQYRRLLKDEIEQNLYIQYVFYKQWDQLRAYAHKNGVKIIGDMPIYAAYDSADVWSNPQYFKLHANGSPSCVAGVPPDAFSKEGQLWGNPLYDWDALKRDGYGYWIRRIGAATRFFDVIRIDHFRGIESYWEVDAKAKTAKEGRWVKGPGIDFVNTITSWFHQTEFIAEDLGILTPSVKEMLVKSSLPGMKVLEFAFEKEEGGSAYLPHKYNENCVCYIGTHDNDTLCGWIKTCKKNQIRFAKEYLSCGEDLADGIIRAGMRSKAALFIVQMQDWLSEGSEARINTPGTSEGNWQYRMKTNAANADLAKKIKKITQMYNR